MAFPSTTMNTFIDEVKCMVILMGLINIIVIPFVGVEIYYKVNGWKFNGNMELMTRYIAFVAINYVIDTIILAAVGLSIENYSNAYGVLAFITACLLPFFTTVLNKYIEIELEIKKHD